MGMFAVKKFWDVKKIAIAFAFCGSLLCSPALSTPASAAQPGAKTFVGVLWPMFGPLPAIGLVELTAEIKNMPDVEVHTYLHQEWPDLVRDMSRLPEGTHTIVIGYSLGANATSWVVNKSKYVDLVIALQPSVFSWNPVITGRAGRIIEVYNPNTWETFGGMGSKKLEWSAGNIEFMPNHDSHPGAQFNTDFRNMVKTEVAKMSTAPDIQVAQNDSAKDAKEDNAKLTKLVGLSYAEDPSSRTQKDFAAKLPAQISQGDAPKQANAAQPQAAANPAQAAATQMQAARGQKDTPAKPAPVAQTDLPKLAKADNLKPDTARPERVAMAGPVQALAPAPSPALARAPASGFAPALATTSTLKASSQRQPKETVAFLDTLSGTVNSGDLTATKRELTVDDMVGYAKRTYQH